MAILRYIVNVHIAGNWFNYYILCRVLEELIMPKPDVFFKANISIMQLRSVMRVIKQMEQEIGTVIFSRNIAIYIEKLFESPFCGVYNLFFDTDINKLFTE